jgi:hypothetical protein
MLKDFGGVVPSRGIPSLGGSNAIAAEGLGRALQSPPGSGAPSRFEHVIWKTGVERRGTAICWAWGSGYRSMG